MATVASAYHLRPVSEMLPIIEANFDDPHGAWIIPEEFHVALAPGYTLPEHCTSIEWDLSSFVLRKWDNPDDFDPGEFDHVSYMIKLEDRTILDLIRRDTGVMVVQQGSGWNAIDPLECIPWNSEHPWWEHELNGGKDEL